MSKLVAKLLNNVFVFAGFLFIVLGLLFYFLLGRGAAEVLTDQALQRQLIVARSGASSIEAFFGLFGKSLALLADSSLAQEDLDSFVESWGDTPVAGVILTDAGGMVIVNSTRTGEMDIGASISDRDYYGWAKAAGVDEVSVGWPVISRFGSSSGKYVVVVATPIHRDREFQGVLAGAILLSDLTYYYLQPLKLSENTQVYIVSQDGTIIDSPLENLVGVNYFDYITESNIPGASEIVRIFEEQAKSNEEGKLNIALPGEGTGKLTPFLLAYSPINYNHENHWNLAVATPVADALAMTTPLYVRGIVVLVVTFLVLMGFASRIAKIRGFSEGFTEHGKLHNEKNHKGVDKVL